ncbi:hypothetical protein [Vibrio jasicida]|uniref:hypothetical protein n=1 Tax=Vibrio jasicida TaxID=766224 RepID=UPI0005EEDF06|nr:hypothetical protein [Vibrio jasicida]
MGVEVIEQNGMFNTILNGNLIHSEKIYHANQDKNQIEQVNEEVLLLLLTCKVADLPTPFAVDGDYFPKNGSEIDYLTIKNRGEGCILSVMMTKKLINWKQLFTIGEYSDHIQTISSNISTDIDEGYAYISCTLKLAPTDNLNEKATFASNLLLEANNDTLNKLNKAMLDEYILETFQFPREYQSICSQYLIWFGEFLENIGIDALVSVNNDGEQTQVKISSKHSEQVLEKIEELFSQYIALPYAEFLPAAHPLDPQQQFMVTQLRTQINHFKGQLEVKSSVIQLKEATIQGLQREIQSQQNIIDVQKNQLLLIESKQGDEEVELFGGVIKLGELVWGPIKFSPKKLLEKTNE